MADFRNDRYYCLECPLHPENDHNRFVTVGGCRIHLQNPEAHNGHGVQNPKPGVHYVNGYQARQIFYRRQYLADEEAKQLAAYLESVPRYTAVDFLVDFKAPKAV